VKYVTRKVTTLSISSDTPQWRKGAPQKEETVTSESLQDEQVPLQKELGKLHSNGAIKTEKPIFVDERQARVTPDKYIRELSSYHLSQLRCTLALNMGHPMMYNE
jgi:hypothetical protein